MNRRANQEQVWVDKEFKEFLREIIRRKSLAENHDFSFGDITEDIVRCTELKNNIEKKLLRRGKENEARLF